MKVFIVHAHHEPSSFNGSLTRAAVASLRDAGHEVQLSDLYEMNFDPVSDRRNFTTVKDPNRLKQQVEEEHASMVNGYVPELQAEMDKLAWCDVLILQFPLWWLGMPAILKGGSTASLRWVGLTVVGVTFHEGCSAVNAPCAP